LIFLHAATGLSLRQTVARAEIAGLATVSDVALLKRLRTSEPWLRHLSNEMLAALSGRVLVPKAGESFRLRAVDSTTVEEPGATGTNWRIHYSICLPSLECDHFEVTDAKGGESLKRVPVSKGDVILADRGYCHRAGIAHVVDSGGDAIVRLSLGTFPLVDSRGHSLNLLPRLRRLTEYKPGEWKAWFEGGGNMYEGRLCAVRKSVAAVERAKQRMLRIEQKKQKQFSADAFEAASYFFVFTTLRKDVATTNDVLEMYRARWQIELAFKRLKSLFGAGHVPKYDPESARAWIQAKLLAVLMIERLEQEAARFSPWGYTLPPA
jgi:hypothetical protein